MKKKSTSQSAPVRRSLSTRRSLARRLVGEGGFFNLRVLIGLCIALAGVSLALVGIGALSATAAPVKIKNHIITASNDPLVPVGFDCSKIQELGIDKQENFRAGAIMIACGAVEGGWGSSSAALSFNASGRLSKNCWRPCLAPGTST